jgi:hypothetical protein
MLVASEFVTTPQTHLVIRLKYVRFPIVYAFSYNMATDLINQNHAWI